ncbi:exopolysaccharide biosynthesis polyprenyl glycosylphosphotransferase [Paenibacillus sp. LMG 31456]|uniref:Exopolysaccharide biosynthesis polyprenyl glycosylphosphotransferase n=1 Tax=Paenibacillus foliorum TaxID=2654974 RepID=A0A972GYL7_9BACL|nr:sugar transferase [Paenibacillus foliorum]NOU92956.1 exopolysaccharide biosynthesis polyprenyl glycosylphosphotransferase [Paenibacillus foliorum]
MNYSYATQKNKKEHFIPTMEINKKLGTKKMYSFFLATVFIALEALVIALLYFYLYEYRIGQEFDRDIVFWDMASPRFVNYSIFFVISSIIYIYFMYRYKIFRFRSQSGLADEIFKVAKAYSVSLLITIGVSFLLKYTDLSRIVIASYWIAAIISSSIVRSIKRFIYIKLAKEGILSKNVVIVGAGKFGKSLMEELSTYKYLGYHIIGFVDDNEQDDFEQYKNLGPISKLNEILKNNLIEEIIITIPSERELVNKLITDLRKLDINIKIIPDLYNLVMSTVQIGNINSLPVVTLVKTPMRGLGLFAKRIMDIIAASILIIFISPIYVLTAIAIKLDSKGSIIYKQQRIGRNGKTFSMLKFRSMVSDADVLLKKLKNKNEIDGIAFKMKDDPRITKVGKFIRKYSIDELPQLFNVLIGNMSLVGPRPPLPHEVERYGDWEWRRLEVLPGITGLWQVSGRSDLSFQQWMSLDIYYIENWSIAFDIKILMKTIPVVLKGEGAY